MLKANKVSMILKGIRKHRIKPITINGVKYYIVGIKKMSLKKLR